jgi:hypothetical protein
MAAVARAIASLVVCLGLVSCAVIGADAMPAEKAYGLVDGAAPEASDAAGTPAATPDADSAASLRERLLVRSAELGLEVARPEDAVARCETVIEGKGGWVERRDGGRLVARVPVDAFESVLGELRGFGRVLRDVVQAEDVTEQHRDLVIRLDNAKRARERLLALLEKAEKVEDLLKIEGELRRLTEEIESMTAVLQNLDGRIAHARIAVEFRAPAGTDRQARRRPSRFEWINRVGAEHVLRNF